MVNQSFRDAILIAAVQVLIDRGETGWSVERVADAAECAKGLVLYHYRAKRHLLAQAGGKLRDRLVDERLASLSAGKGAAAVDDLWDCLVAQVTSGLFRAWLGLHGSADRDIRASVAVGADHLNKLREAVAGALGLAGGPVSAVLLEAGLTGFQLQLLEGTAKGDVQEAYDRFWLVILDTA